MVAYSGARNELLVVECKSYLDSFGVRARELDGLPASGKSRYKLFVEPDPLRRVILNRLVSQLAERGFCRPDVTVQLALACGKIHGKDGVAELHALAERDGWRLIEPSWLVDRLTRAAEASYENEIASVTAKLLLR